MLHEKSLLRNLTEYFFELKMLMVLIEKSFDVNDSISEETAL